MERQPSPSASAYRPPKPQRVLACVLCQQRKVKCERKFPCTHCVRAGVQCVPAQQMPRRRKRPTELELVERLRQCEELLRRNNIAVDVRDGGETGDVTAGLAAMGDEAAGKSEETGEVKNFWDAMHQRSPDSRDVAEAADVDDGAAFDDLSEPAIVKVWGRVYESDHTHLFGPSKIDGPLYTLHPSHVQIFRLWQVYSDNINPLLKVTHCPTLQARILDAAVDPADVSPELQALMFGIYCAATMSLTEDECRAALGEAKAKLLRRYQDACHQALIECGFLRSRERECLTAYFLYLISLRPDTHPHTLSPMFAIAFRIAYRMNICNEAANARHGVFEAEMRRRLWWAMVVYDSRISEMTDYKTTQLIPTWDCKIPVNVNDFDLRPDMTTRPADHEAPTEALFAVVRAAIGNAIRHNAWHLDFINPLLRHVAKATQHLFDPHDADLHTLERIIETRHLKTCNPENPLHYMTIWWARNYLAKYRFFLHCSQHSKAPGDQPTHQRDRILSYALRMLECDTALTSSPLTRGYRWLIQFHFPFPAYVRIVQDLRSRPVSPHAARAWAVMSANYAPRFVDMEPSAHMLFKMFASSVLQAWAARHDACEGRDDAGARAMIADIRRKLGYSEFDAGACATGPLGQEGLLTPPDPPFVPARDAVFDPSLAELNADAFEMDWGGDWSAMAGLEAWGWP